MSDSLKFGLDGLVERNIKWIIASRSDKNELAQSLSDILAITSDTHQSIHKLLVDFIRSCRTPSVGFNH